MGIQSTEELLLEELRDLYDAERQLVKGLPGFVKASSDEELVGAFQNHLEQTKRQVRRIEEVFAILGERPKSKPCKGMQGLLEEGREKMRQQEASAELADSAILGAAQKVEHYEMAAYLSARSLAQALGMRDAAQLLQENLREEEEQDRALSKISKRLIKEANASGMETGEEKKQERPRTPRRRAAGERGPNGGRTKSGGGGRTRTTIDHGEIRRWAEERGAHPAKVKGTEILRLDFPGYTGPGKLEPIEWDEFFENFDDRGLALVYQEKTSRGRKSNFNKLVERRSAA